MMMMMMMMKVITIPIVIGAFGTVTEGLLKGRGYFEITGGVETIQTTILMRTARIVTQTPVKDHLLTL